jgi:hypothetical protein
MAYADGSGASVEGGGLTRHRRRVLWFALIGGGAAWMARFLVIWIISEFGCIGGAPTWSEGLGTAVVMMLASLPFLGIAMYAAFLSFRLRRVDVAHHADRDNTIRFLATTGLIVNPLFAGIMLVESLPMFYFLNECRAFSL